MNRSRLSRTAETYTGEGQSSAVLVDKKRKMGY